MHKICRLIPMFAVVIAGLLAKLEVFAQGSELDTPSRIASVNLCTDQLLLALADSDQIAGLGPYAGDPHRSYLAHKAGAFPVLRGVAEELIHKPFDLVLLGPFDGVFARNILKQRNVPFEIVTAWRGIEDGKRSIRHLSLALGQKERGDALIEDIDRELKQLKKTMEKRPEASALILQRYGYTEHQSVLADLLQVAGLVPTEIKTQSGRPFASLEEIVIARPDYLVVERSARDPQDQGEARLMHPVLQRLYPSNKRLVIPEKLSVCSGPATPALIRQLTQELAKKPLWRISHTGLLE